MNAPLSRITRYNTSKHDKRVRFGADGGNNRVSVECTFGARTMERRFDDSRLANSCSDNAYRLLERLDAGEITADVAADLF